MGDKGQEADVGKDSVFFRLFLVQVAKQSSKLSQSADPCVTLWHSSTSLFSPP